VRDAANVARAVQFARKFQPSVVFVEDIDRSMQGEDRTEAMDTILNTLDGVDSKKAEVMVVFTSNHADVINRAMIRPGRLDVVIPIEAPDAEAAERLIRVYAGDMIDPSADYKDSGAALAGKSAAVIRETVERAKLYAISQTEAGQTFKLNPDSLITAAKTMERQLDLLTGPKEVQKTAADHFVGMIAEAVAEVLGQPEGKEIGEVTERLLDNSRVVAARLGVSAR